MYEAVCCKSKNEVPVRHGNNKALLYEEEEEEEERGEERRKNILCKTKPELSQQHIPKHEVHILMSSTCVDKRERGCKI